MAFRPGYIQEIRLHAIQVLGGQCVFCGDSNPAHLDIHHINPKNVGGSRGSYNRAREGLKLAEQGKGLLLCNICHDKLHVRLERFKWNPFIGRANVERFHSGTSRKDIEFNYFFGRRRRNE